MPIPHPEPAPDTPELSPPGLISPLIHIHDRAIWYHRQAIQALQAGLPAATTWNNQALALYVNNAAFHALAGQLWAPRRVSAGARRLGKARHLNPSTRLLMPICKVRRDAQTLSLNHEESVTNLPVSDYSWYAPRHHLGQGSNASWSNELRITVEKVVISTQEVVKRDTIKVYQSASLHT